jgi:hypothetical protein
MFARRCDEAKAALRDGCASPRERMRSGPLASPSRRYCGKETPTSALQRCSACGHEMLPVGVALRTLM